MSQYFNDIFMSAVLLKSFDCTEFFLDVFDGEGAEYMYYLSRECLNVQQKRPMDGLPGSSDYRASAWC
jgi:hypothetical protein